jgi:hypothetical protein
MGASCVLRSQNLGVCLSYPHSVIISKDFFIFVYILYNPNERSTRYRYCPGKTVTCGVGGFWAGWCGIMSLSPSYGFGPIGLGSFFF